MLYTQITLNLNKTNLNIDKSKAIDYYRAIYQNNID